jgi:hypothetical protein
MTGLAARFGIDPLLLNAIGSLAGGMTPHIWCSRSPLKVFPAHQESSDARPLGIEALKVLQAHPAAWGISHVLWERPSTVPALGVAVAQIQVAHQPGVDVVPVGRTGRVIASVAMDSVESAKATTWATL